MEANNFVLLWKEHYEKIDQSLMINKRLLGELLHQKADSAIRSLMRGKALGLVAGILYLLLLGALLWVTITHYKPAFIYFALSIGGIFLINVKAVYDYIRHLVILGQLKYDGSVVEIQGRLLSLQASLVRHCRIMVLQFPLWTTFFLSPSWFPGQAPLGYIFIQVVMTGFFLWIAVWLYRAISLQNLQNRWVNLFVSGVGGQSVVKVLDLYEELGELETQR